MKRIILMVCLCIGFPVWANLHSKDSQQLRASVSHSSQASLQTIRLNFQDISVRALLHIVADLGHLNIVLSPNVKGNMSLHLERVSWQQAMDIILQTQNLAQRQIEGAWFIGTPAEILAQNTAAKELAKTEEGPVITEYLPVRYADPKGVANIVKQTFPNVFISQDARSHLLIIKGHVRELSQVKVLLDKMDVPMQQVLIKARIAVVDESALQELGVVMGQQTDSLLQQMKPINGASINLPVSSPAGTISFSVGHWPSGRSIDLELQALEAQGKGEIISSPKLLVSDNQQAVIEQGNEIPFQTATSSGATQIEFKKAVLGLHVTPHITSSRQIMLNLQINDDSLSKNEATSENVPIVSTSKVSTNVLVNNNQTVVLGGIHIEEIRHDKQGVPYLDRIPGLGILFRHSTDSDRKTELIVFVTPQIIT